MAAATLHAAGTGATSPAATLSVSPVWPAVTALDIAIAQVVLKDTPMDSIVTPSGFSPIYPLDPGADAPDASLMQSLFAKVCTGSETGAEVISVTGGNSAKSARIYTFTGTGGTREGAAASRGNGATFFMPDITTVGVDRLCCAFNFTRDNTAMIDATGEAGGNWAEAAAEYAGGAGRPTLQLQTATLAVAGSITAPTFLITAMAYGSRVFAFLPGTTTLPTLPPGSRGLLLGVG